MIEKFNNLSSAAKFTIILTGIVAGIAAGIMAFAAASGGLVILGTTALASIITVGTTTALASFLQENHYRNDFFDLLGLNPPKIKVSISKESGDDKNYVLCLENIVPFDEDVLNAGVNKITEAEDVASAKKVKEELAAQTKKVMYSIKMTIPIDMTLGELAFCDVGNLNSIITAHETTSEGKNTIRPVNDSEKEKIVETLNLMPKFLGNDTKDANKEIKAAVEDGSVKKAISQDSPPDDILKSDTFFNNLVDIAVKTGKYGILNNYEEALIAQTNKSAKIAAGKQKITEECKNKWNNKAAKIIQLIAGPAIIIGCVFALTGPFAIGAGAALVITTTLIVAAALTINKITSSIRNFFKKGKNALEIAAKKEKEMREKYEGLKKTTDAIEKLITDKEQHCLSLEGNTNEKLKDKSIMIISQWLRSDSSSNCQELKLNKNSITDKGAEFIAQALKKSSAIKTVNLKDNLITEDGLQKISAALSENPFTTRLECDLLDNKPVSTTISTNIAIKQQLLINNYMQGNNITEFEIERYFGEKITLEEIKAKSIEKINSINDMETLKILYKQINKANLLPIKTAAIERQIQIIINKQTKKENYLMDYLDIYNNIVVGKENLGEINQTLLLKTLGKIKQVPLLNEIENIMFIRKKKEITGVAPSKCPELENLCKMDESSRISLINNCFKKIPIFCKKGEAQIKSMAVIIANIITIPDFFVSDKKTKDLIPLREYLVKMPFWHNKDEDAKLDIAQQFKSLEALASGKHKDEINSIIKSAKEAHLIAKIKEHFIHKKPTTNELIDVMDDLSSLADKLNATCDLIEFDYNKLDPMIDKLDPAVSCKKEKIKQVVENIIIKNKLNHLFESNPKNIAFIKFFEIFNTIQDQDQAKMCLQHFTAVKDSNNREKLKNLIINNIDDIRLANMEENRLLELITSCIADENNARSNAIIFSKLAAIKDKDAKIPKILKDILNKKEDFNTYIDTLRRLAENSEKDPDKRDVINTVITAIMEKNTLDEINTLNDPKKPDAFEQFKDKIYKNTNLKMLDCNKIYLTDSIKNTEIKDLISYIITRNIALPKIQKNPSLDNFFASIKTMNPKYYGNFFHNLQGDALDDILSKLTRNITTNIYENMVSLEENLRIGILKNYFIFNDSRESFMVSLFGDISPLSQKEYATASSLAKAKAQLISDLLKTLPPLNQKHDKLTQDLLKIIGKITKCGDFKHVNLISDAMKSIINNIVTHKEYTLPINESKQKTEALQIIADKAAKASNKMSGL